MNTKKFIYAGMMASVLIMSSCSDDEAFFAASASDSPRILNKELATMVSGGMYDFGTFNRNENFKYDLIVTPVEYSTAKWQVNGEYLCDGKSVDVPMLAGVYTLRTDATSEGGTTYREGTLTIKPLYGDPVVTNIPESSLIVSSGQTAATLQGENLSGIKNVRFYHYVDGKRVGVDAPVTSASATQLVYDIPELDTRGYHLALVDAEGNEYGAAKQSVSVADDGKRDTTYSSVIVRSSNLPCLGNNKLSAGPGGECTVTGVNLDKVTEITIGGKPAVIKSADKNSITFAAPQLEPGNYDFVAKYGDNVVLSSDKYSVSEQSLTFNITEEVTLREYDEGITAQWNDGLIKFTKEQLAGVPEGATIIVYWEMIDAEYHQMQINTPWWGDGMIVDKFDLTDSTPKPFTFEYTAKRKNTVETCGGAMCIVGFGYKVTKVAYK